jgi:MFS family permease
LKDYSPDKISWIFAVQLALMWAPGPLFGRMIDTYGPAPILYPGAVLCVFGLCMTSLADQYYQIFLAQGLAFGIGSGGVFTTAFVCVGQWFVRRRGLGVGLASVGSSLGGVVFPIYLDRITRSIGLPGALRYTALFIGILLALACFTVKARLPRKKWNHELKWFDKALFRQKSFALYTLGAYFVMWGLWGPFDFVSAMAQSKGTPPTLSLYLISIINATSVPGRILPPYMGDKFGYFNVITVCSLMSGVSILALWLPFSYHPATAGFIVFVLIYGFVSGAFVSMLMPCAAKSGSLETLGQRFGTFQTVIAIRFAHFTQSQASILANILRSLLANTRFSCLTGLPIMGAILNHQGGTDFVGLQLFSGISCLLGGSLLAASTYLYSRSQGSWKV